MANENDQSDEDGVQVERVFGKSREGEEERDDEDAELGCCRPPRGSSSRGELRFERGPYGVGSLCCKRQASQRGTFERRRTSEVKQT